MRLPNILRRLLCLGLACLLLTGCGVSESVPGLGSGKETEPSTEATTEPTEPAPTAPPNGVAGTITEKGVGNGTSMLIFIGIVSRGPSAAMSMISGIINGTLAWWKALLTLGRLESGKERACSRLECSSGCAGLSH